FRSGRCTTAFIQQSSNCDHSWRLLTKARPTRQRSKMKCETVQELLSRYLTDELPSGQKASVKEHLSDCVACREALAFHRSLQSQLDVALQEPLSLHQRMMEKAGASKPTLMTRLLGDTLMKRILISSTAVTALVAATVLIAPRAAMASTPKETFNKM